MEKKIVVSEEMLEFAMLAAIAAFKKHGKNTPLIITEDSVRKVVVAVLNWCSNNPTIPTTDQMSEIHHYCAAETEKTCGSEWEKIPRWTQEKILMAEWQRRMFLAPEPEVLEAVSKIEPGKCPHRWQAKNDDTTMERVVYCELCDWEFSRDALTAYNRGLKVVK